MANQNFKKAGILVFLLVVPVFVFLFLNIFGENRYDLPYYFPELQPSGKVVIDAAGDTVYSQIPQFTLLDQEGKQVNQDDLSGKPTVVNFFFSRCGLICPTMNDNLFRVVDNFAPGQINIASVTVDPEYDSVEVLKSYSSQFVENSDTWKFLTGEKAYIYNLAIKGFKLPVDDASVYNENLSLDETFIHSEKLLLLDAEGYFRGIYDGTNVPDVERLMVEIDILLSNSNGQ